MSKVSISRALASGGTIARLKATFFNSCNISKLSSQIFLRPSGIWSSQSSFLQVNSLISTLIPQIIGVAQPRGSKISDNFPTQSLLVNIVGTTPTLLWSFLPLSFFEKLSSPIFSLSISSLGNHFIPATPTLKPSSDKCSGGFDPEKVIPFKLNPPLPSTSFSWSVDTLTSSAVFSPDMQSSTYMSLWITSHTLGYTGSISSAVFLRPHSAWFPLDLTPYINVLITFHKGCSLISKLGSHKYSW